MADGASFLRKFENGCSFALEKLGIDNFKEKQNLAIKELILGRDVLVILPTGSGKSLIFQSFPLVLDYMEGTQTPKSIVVVICPLLSLMKDQVNYLQSKGVKAAYLGEGQDDTTVKDGVEKGEYQIVYGSPETFLATSRWRKMLTSSVYRQNLRLIAVDEAHCICHWGFSAKKGEMAFRIWFQRINELRSLVGRVSLLALTATATKETRNQITKTLEMDNAVLISAIPNRRNIAYAVQVTGSDPQVTFQSLINSLREKGHSCDRVIIYCPRIKVVASLYGIFKAELGEDMYIGRDSRYPRKRLVEMYHARIDEQNKDEILTSFSEENGCIRVLIATIAYGMGIDCKGVKDVIHYGPPPNLERYLQESGRAGRNEGLECRAVILYCNVMLQQCDERMVKYVRNENMICRRKLLLSHFDFDLSEEESYTNPHQCCDICQMGCKCDGDSCCFVFFDRTIPQNCVEPTKERCITSDQMCKLTDKMRYLKESLNNSFSEMAVKANMSLLTSVNLLSGFGDCQIFQITQHASRIFSLANVYQFVDIWHPSVAIEILFILNLIFGDIDFDFEDDEMQHDLLLTTAPNFHLWSVETDDEDLFIPADFFTAEDMDGFAEIEP